MTSSSAKPTFPPFAAPPVARAELALDADVAYLDTAYAAPLPRAAADAVRADLDDAAAGSSTLAARQERVGELRARWASLLGADPDDFAVVANTTQGVGLVAGGLDWRDGDVVLVAEGDHEAVVAPWHAQAHRGVEVRAVPLGELPDAVARIGDGGRLRVVAVSWVQAHSGERSDLADLAARAHDVGAVLCADLIQGAGVVPCDLRAWGVDAAAAGAQKWMLGPHGVGAAYLSPPLRQRLLAGDRPASHIEVGAPNHLGIAGALAGAGLVHRAGVDAVWAWVDRRARQLREGAAALGVEVVSPDGARRSALVSLRVGGWAPDAVVARLAAAGVVASARGDGTRLAPAAWTTEAEVDRALDALDALASSR